MKIVEGIFEFIVHLAKSAILIAIIGILMSFALVVFTIFMPDRVIAAFDIIRGFLN